MLVLAQHISGLGSSPGHTKNRHPAKWDAALQCSDTNAFDVATPINKGAYQHQSRAS